MKLLFCVKNKHRQSNMVKLSYLIHNQALTSYEKALVRLSTQEEMREMYAKMGE